MSTVFDDASITDLETQYCRVLAGSGSDADKRNAWKILEQKMAVVPKGDVLVEINDADVFSSQIDSVTEDLLFEVDSFYIDRYAVTNEEYAKFVADGGYEQMAYWPEDIFPQVVQIVDSTGIPGPRFWQNGTYPKEKANHPVVGVCWYEANAYALWAGKTLPSCMQWQRAGDWPGDGNGSKYPWGNAFDPERANLWSDKTNGTVPVDSYVEGATPNGVYQLIGNVWEWVATLFECNDGLEGTRVAVEQPMAEIRGGAFDTYFSSQATCQFRTGQPLMMRAQNIGFRCCTAIEELALPSDPYAFLEDEEQ
ncbi:MAG: SUMF1/EgtB/PvdO family nonheme iron enzyme [Planctomycetales bacterium]|nr:SUMF1/EgtB/PvdO family nonheme iron enzyme [Planctomycetales bacterium]